MSNCKRPFVCAPLQMRGNTAAHLSAESTIKYRYVAVQQLIFLDKPHWVRSRRSDMRVFPLDPLNVVGLGYHKYQGSPRKDPAKDYWGIYLQTDPAL